LDVQLAAGVSSWRSRLHAARALQITSRRSRRGLAAALDRVIEHADWPQGRINRTAVVLPCRISVSAQLPEIRALAVRLRSAEPVAAQGIAMLRLLLSDGAGPIYASGRAAALARDLQAIDRSLEVPD
jgi:hypothetical protein